jgi:hypothetical protein
MKQYLMTLMVEGAVEQAKMDIKCQEEIDKAIKMYWDACKLPRKKKKAMRKIANQEYSFWLWMRDFPSPFKF